MEWIKGRPCCKCGAYGVDAAHVYGIASPKTGLPMPRRRGIAWYAAVPLCKHHHQTGADSIHALGERAFFEAFGQGDGYGMRLVARYLAEYVALTEGVLDERHVN